jgi:signal transduction histidine kinase
MAKMRIQTGDTALHEAVCRRKDGSLFPAEVQGKAITYRGRPARMIIFRDLTERRQAQERLERALSLQQAAFEATADGILAVDRAGQVITYNRVFAEMWGIPDSVLALGDVNLIREHVLHQVVNPDQFVQQVQLLYANPEAISLDTLEFTDGRVIERYTQPQRLGEHIVGRLWDFRDITARIRGQEELEHTLSLQRATFEATADGILAVDIQGRLVTYNHKFVEMWNIPEAMLSPNTDGYWALLYGAQRLKEPNEVVDKLVKLHGNPEIISLDLVELTDGRIFERYTQPQRMGSEIIGRVWNFRDVTERRRLEAERERLIAGLEEALHVKDRFLATMSHELRTPLNAIMGYCNLLLSGMAGQVDAVAREMLERIDISSTLLLNLITQVLDLARLGAGQMALHPRWVTPRQLADEWCGQMKVLAQQKGLDLQLDIAPDVPEQVYVDADRVTQIALNLLSNALKFTERGWVRLTLKGQADTWQIEVRDTGIGIPPDALGYIFEAFRQVDSSSTRSYGGAGLGLAIVRNLCGIMGGKIEVESPQGQGSIFTVTLPVQFSQAQ